MKESYEEELLATRFGLLRRAGYGNVSGLSVREEGVAGQPLSSEIFTFVCRPCSDKGKAMPKASSWARRPQDTAESENLSMRPYSNRENREIPEVPMPNLGAGRLGKVHDHKPSMHASGKSGGLVVPSKQGEQTGRS